MGGGAAWADGRRWDEGGVGSVGEEVVGGNGGVGGSSSLTPVCLGLGWVGLGGSGVNEVELEWRKAEVWWIWVERLGGGGGGGWNAWVNNVWRKQIPTLQQHYNNTTTTTTITNNNNNSN